VKRTRPAARTKIQLKETNMRWIIALVVVVGILAWGWQVEHRAESKAKDFCNGVAVGSSFADLAEIVKTVGEDRLRFIHEDSISVGFTGIPPFSRHVCVIDRSEDKVAAKRYVYVD